MKLTLVSPEMRLIVVSKCVNRLWLDKERAAYSRDKLAWKRMSTMVGAVTVDGRTSSAPICSYGQTPFFAA